MEAPKLNAMTIPILMIPLVFSMTTFGATPTSEAKHPPVEHREVPDDPPGHRPATPPDGVVSRSGPVAVGDFISVQVNVDESGDNIPGDAANEPSMAVDPTDSNKMAIGWRQFDTVTSNFRQAGVAYSDDGGQTWTASVLDSGQFRSDPVLASDADGNFYYSSLSSITSVEVFKSLNGGVTWTLPVSAFGGDKQWMTIDKTAGPKSGTIYQIWNVQFSCCGANDFTLSTNGGASFDGPFAVPTPSMKWGTMDVGPDGTLYLAGVTLNGSGHLFCRTNDEMAIGPSFDPVQSISLGGTTGFSAGPNPAGLLGQVGIAADQSDGPTQGNIYVLASVNPPGADPLDVMFIRSVDGGDTWSVPVRVNDDPIGNNAWQWFGTMAVAPNGRIDAIWNDTRADPTVTFSELYYAYSIDAGSSWSENTPVSPSYNHSLGYPMQNKLGDYYHMVSDDEGANLAYAATFNGEQDVYFLRIAPDCNSNGVHDGTDVLGGFSPDCNGNAIPDECEFPGCPGILLADMNCDGATDGLDIQPFTELLAASGYTCQADMNQDGAVDIANDLTAFVNTLLGSP